MTHLEDRRRKRSQDPLIALHYQLSHARHDGDLDAIVVADTQGLVVAGAGSWAVCEELAAYAPILAQGTWHEPGAANTARIAKMSLDVDIRPLEIDGQEVYLCVRGGTVLDSVKGAVLDRAQAGVRRILKTAA